VSDEFSKTFSLGNQKLFYFVLLLSVSTVWLSPYPPMVDLAQHAAQITALQEIWSGDPVFSASFEINWFTPYIVGYLCLYLLAVFFPVAIAAKLIISAVFISIPLLSGQLLREIGADERWRWLVIPSGFSIAFFWGFIPYLVAVPVGLYLLVQTVRFGHVATFRRGIGIALIAVTAFFCHILVMAFCSLVALLHLAGLYYRQPRELFLRWLPYTAPIPLILVWSVLTRRSEAYIQDAAVAFSTPLERLQILLFQPSGIDNFIPALSVILSLLIFSFPLLAGARLSTKPERWLPLAGGLAAFFLLPSVAAGTIFIFHRLDVFLIPLWLLAWEYKGRRPDRLGWIAMLVVLIAAMINVTRFTGFVRESRGFTEVLEVMEPRRNLLYFPIFAVSRHFGPPVYLHFASWYQVEKKGITDFNFAFFYGSQRIFRVHKAYIEFDIGIIVVIVLQVVR